MITRSHTRKRTRMRKPRFLSLRRQLAGSSTRTVVDADEKEARREKQLDLFPLHPEFEEAPKADGREEDDADADDGSCCPSSHFFVDPDYGLTATLTSLLGSTAAMDVTSEREASTPSASPSTSVNFGLARSALRGRERWVFCGEEEDDEGESSSAGMVYVRSCEPRGLLCLKLDYEEVLTAWSDKGPLYVEGEGSPQMVPQHQTLFVDVGGANSNSGSGGRMWTVPENASWSSGSSSSSREERVTRYREKRRSRLFSNKIRYEVRKANAEKRPRIKGRFARTMGGVA